MCMKQGTCVHSYTGGVQLTWTPGWGLSDDASHMLQSGFSSVERSQMWLHVTSARGPQVGETGPFDPVITLISVGGELGWVVLAVELKQLFFFFFLRETACLAPPPAHLSWCVDVCHFKSYEHRLWELFLIIAYIFSEKRTPGSRGWWVGGTLESPAVPSYPRHPPQQKQPDPARVAVLARLHFVFSRRVPFAAQASASQAQRLLLHVLLFRNLGSTVKIL